MKNKPVRVGDLEIFGKTSDISEVEENLLIATYKLNDRQIECIKKELSEIRSQETFNCYDIKEVISFWLVR